MTKIATSATTTELGLEFDPITKDMQEDRTGWITSCPFVLRIGIAS